MKPELHCVRDNKQTHVSNSIVRAKEHDEEQHESGNARNLPAQHCEPGKFKCLLSVHVGDIKGTTTRQTANSLLAHLNDKVDQCKIDYGNFLHTGVHREHFPGVVNTHQYVYVDSTTPIENNIFIGKG